MWSEAITKILNALVLFAWVALAWYAFWYLRGAIKAAIPRVDSVEMPGLKVSMKAAEEAMMGAGTNAPPAPEEMKQVHDLVNQAIAQQAQQAMNDAEQLAAKRRPWAVHVPEEDKAAAVARAARERALLDGAEILWVDDRPGNNRHEWQMFRAFGSHITAAASTDEALVLIVQSRQPAGRPFHVVISDIDRGPSGDSGLRTLDVFRLRGERLPLIFYVGTIDPSPAPAGAFGLTNRPDQLLNLVLDALAHTRALA